MKILIKFEGSDIFLDINMALSIKTLKIELSKELNIKHHLIVLLEESRLMDDNDIIYLSNDYTRNLLMFVRNDIGEYEFLNKVKSEETIQNLIMNVTGAKEEIEPKNKRKRTHQFLNHSNFLNQIFSTSPMLIPGVFTNNVRVRQELENLFLPFMQNNTSSNIRNEVNVNLQINDNGSNASINNANISSSNINLNENSVSNPLLNNNIRHPIQIIQNVSVDEAKLKTLVELGFSEESSKKALLLTANDIDSSAELLLSGRIDEMPSNINMQSFFISNFQDQNENNNNYDVNNSDHDNI
jgi:hypothetical protein